MASLCKRQQCTIERRGFRQELDSWRHKLIHCVGFESILEGLFGPELIEDLKLFKDCEPVAVSDWSFDENCLFCCLRRDKVKEHLASLSNENLEDTPKPLLVKDQAAIIKLEKQAEEFLNAVLYRKDVPSFSDPHIPVVAREILQKMIRQFAAEYTSTASSPQDICSDSQFRSDQSLPTEPSGAPLSTTLAASAHDQNPVLSKLLMADQDAPLDLTIKKPQAEPSEQDGVLDLSLKRNRHSSSSLPVHSSYLSPPTPTIKGESPSAKAKELQSTSTLEQLMAKLCRHHQRQIVDAIGFLQTEVKAFNTSQTSNSTCGIQGITTTSSLVAPEKSYPELRFSNAASHQSRSEDVSRDFPGSCTTAKTLPETAVSLKTSSSAGPPLDLHRSESESIQGLVTSTHNFVDTENNRHGDHAPLKMKIMKTSNIADGKKLSCVLTTSLSSHAGVLEERQGSSNSSNRTEALSARLSPSVKRHNQASHTHPVRQRETLRHAKDSPSKPFSVHVTIPSDPPRTARKTIRASSDHRTRDSVCRVPVDPDLGHCDIVYIDKPITECLREQQRNMLPRRNARKSTRGHMYVEEMWELKTVRTLAGRNERGNCPNPMPDVITLVTPKQMLSKPDGVPPVDMPFAAGCREKMNQQTPTEESGERVVPGTGDMGEVAAGEIDVIVETSQTDQSQTKGQSASLSPLSPQTEEKETDITAEKVQDATTDSRTTTESEESVAQAEAGKDSTPESREDIPESTDQVVAEPTKDSSENNAVEKLPSAEIHNRESAQENSDTSAPSEVSNVQDNVEVKKKEGDEDEQPQEIQPEMQTHHDNVEVTETANTEGPAEEEMVKEQEVNTVAPVDSLTSVDTQNDDDDDDDEEEEEDKYDVSSKTLDALLKELPPWRRKRGTTISLPKRLKQTKTVIVGYVNGRPISASDRRLRHRSSNTTTSPKKTPVKSKNVPKNASDDPPAESKHSTKQLHEAHVPEKSAENTPLSQEAESSPDTPASPKAKCPSRTKEFQKQTQKEQDALPALPDQPLDCPQSTDSKRYLRSAKQKPAAASTRPPAARDPPSAEHSLSPQCSSSPPPISSPPRITRACPPAASEQSQMDTVPETEKPQAVDTNCNKTKKAEAESGLQAKKKLRSAKSAADICKNEKEQVSSEVSKPLEDPVLVENEMETQLRGKRVLRKEVSDFRLQKKPSVSFIDDSSVGVDESSSSVSEKLVRMPLRSESSKAELSYQSALSPPMHTKKFALRSQRFAAVSAGISTVAERQRDVASPTRIKPERITKNHARHSASSTLPHSSVVPVFTPRSEPLKHNAQKFFEALHKEENQHLIANLNIKYDKMQKGWVQMDKEGQPATKYKNKADRQAAIWKSKRRARKPKSSEHQKYSPVQMLFMKNFDLGSICRWFLESTETKSLVIVKKVNTRLPAETQLCFHSSSGVSGTSQGVFPSLQAERLKKHLKKFAIASPVKSNPKSQKLIAKALEQEANAVKGKERKEIFSVAQTLTKSSSSTEAHVQIGESQKSSGKSKNPASARILRKYSNIRGKMHVQQTNVRLKETSTKKLKATRMKTLSTKHPKSNLKAPLKVRKASLTVKKRMKQSDVKIGKGKPLAGKKTTKLPVVQRAVKAQSGGKAQRNEMPKRYSRRLGSPKTSDHNLVNSPATKVDSNKKHSEAELEKSSLSKVSAGKIQTKEPSQSTLGEVRGSEDPVETPQQSGDVKVPVSPDQVLTRSQRKMEALVPLSPSAASKKAAKSGTTQSGSPETAKKAEKPIVTRSGASQSVVRRSQTASTQSRTPKLTKKRAQELLETPAKRTRMSLSK